MEEEEQSLFKRALSRAMFYCSKAERCPADVLKKLEDWQIDRHGWSDIIQTLKTENFLSDQRYAEAFVRDKIRYNKWGRKKVLFQLKNKGLHGSAIEDALYSIDEDEYYGIVRYELAKKSKATNEDDPYKRKAKLFNFATSRGYEGNIAEAIIEELLNDNE